MPSATFIQAYRYLADVRAAVEVLERDDAARYLDNTAALDPARIKTVPDLIATIAQRSQFAAAVGGDEAATSPCCGA